MSTTPSIKNEKRQLSKEALRSPRVAWWTLALFVGCVVVWLGAFGLVVSGMIPLWVGFVALTAAAFAAFTPAHDAAHRSVARARWVNEVVGRISALLFLAPFGAFRYMHLEHHKHTNDEEHDPDYWSGRGPWWQLPLRWLSQDLHYYALYPKVWHRRPVAERWETLLTILALWGSVVALCVAGYAWPVLMLWVLPARIAVAGLAYCFDYLPHKPHHIRSSEDRYKATVVRPHPVLTPLFLYQNYHLIHHLYPGVPFYRYGTIWRAKKPELLAKGAEMRDLLGHPITETPEEGGES